MQMLWMLYFIVKSVGTVVISRLQRKVLLAVH